MRFGIRLFAVFIVFWHSSALLAKVETANDPLEPLNRAIFQFNILFDDFLFVPVSFVYNKTVPNPMARGIKNFLSVLGTPISCTCHILSGNGEKAASSFLRGVINLTLGFSGFVDVATDMGLTAEPMTVGKLFGRLGIGTGPYLMLPFWGPSNPRDLCGDAVEGFYDPVGRASPPHARLGSYLARLGVSTISTRAGVLEVESAIRKQSPDYYETFRCLYWQKVYGSSAEDTPVPSNEED
ncbi:MAG: VacJ family lipoprotein [Holosporales bacterium]|jgi:phospholipid-binding lipoprotein MlaA|nr:VacJ family lipoprotein [Holosporales bacterium]